MPDKDNNKHQTIGQVLTTTHVKKNPVVTFAAGEHHSVPYNDKHDNRRQTMAQTTSKHTHTHNHATTTAHMRNNTQGQTLQQTASNEQ